MAVVGLMSCKPHHLIAIVFVLSVHLALSSVSFARPLRTDHHQLDSSTNLAVEEFKSKQNFQLDVVSCDLESTTTVKSASEGFHNNQVAEKRYGVYGSIVLNVLPKGTITPSGPSKGTNDVNN